MEKLLQGAAMCSPDWVEVRYQERRSLTLSVRNGQLEQCSSGRTRGAGLRARTEGAFGFASTTDVTEHGLRAARDAARELSAAASGVKRERSAHFAAIAPSQGAFPIETTDPLDAHSIDEKIALVMRLDERVRLGSQLVCSSSVVYAETLEERIVATSDGVLVRVQDSRPSLRILAVASSAGKKAMGLQSIGISGGWTEFQAARCFEVLVDDATRIAVEELAAPHAPGGPATVVLDPELVGTLCHEAIGHTVEADLVLGGAITANRIGTRVASELVTMCDAGMPSGAPHVVGRLPVDDEGVPATRTVLIERGVLRSFLHNRETAARFGVPPTGNARAFLYSDEPIIRMTNTYIERGETPVEALFGGVESGYYLRGFAMSGQADSSAEFMFGVREAQRIERGKLTGRVKGMTISGNAFDVLQSIDAVGDDFAWENGAGFCGKGQPAKVDAGGPHVRCRIALGGRQE